MYHFGSQHTFVHRAIGMSKVSNFDEECGHPKSATLQVSKRLEKYTLTHSSLFIFPHVHSQKHIKRNLKKSLSGE